MTRFNSASDLPERYQEQARKQLGKPRARAARGRPEANFQQQVVDLAHVHGWRVFHPRASKQANGEHRTAVAYDGAGFPDLVLARAGRVLIVELKSGRGSLRPNQREWKREIEGSGLYRMWHPHDFPVIEEELR